MPPIKQVAFMNPEIPVNASSDAPGYNAVSDLVAEQNNRLYLSKVTSGIVPTSEHEKIASGGSRAKKYIAIVHPVTKNTLNLYSKAGRQVIKNYYNLRGGGGISFGVPSGTSGADKSAIGDLLSIGSEAVEQSKYDTPDLSQLNKK